jgi:hypothetical protein
LQVNDLPVLQKRMTHSKPLTNTYETQESGNMKKRILAILVFACASIQLWAQAPVAGTWDFSMSSPMGSVNAKVLMVVDGSTLSGEFDLGGGRKWVIENGSIDGNTISFSINRDGASMTYEMSAVIEGDTAQGSAQAMGSAVEWTMTRASQAI